MKSNWLVELGYNPLPVKAGKKFCHVKGWPDKQAWCFTAPGIGLSLRGLVMIDIDVEDPSVSDELVWALDPDEKVPLRTRASSGRAALLFRLPADWDAERGRCRTAKFTDAEGRDARVEVKWGASEFMFGWGTHPSGDVLQWSHDGADFPLFEDLPEAPPLDVVLSKADEICSARLERAEDPPNAISGGESAHDLRWDMEFAPGGDAEDHGTLRDLCAGPGDEAWVNLTPWRPTSDSGSGHLYWGSEMKGPVLHDFVAQVTHFLAPEERVKDEDDSDAENEALMGDLEVDIDPLPTPERPDGPEVAREDPRDADPELGEWFNRLIYIQAEERIYVKDDPEAQPLTKMGAFGHLQQRERDDLFRELPRAHQTVWDPRSTARSVLHVGAGRRDFNLFAPPAHPTEGGETQGFFDFLNHFLPDEFEREIFLDWLALKTQNPGERYFAMVLYGAQGSGKGLTTEVLGLLHGHRYVKTANLLTLFDGKYDNMLHQSLYVCIDETSGGSTRHFEKEQNFEKLKRIVDPRAKEMELNIKRGNMFPSMVYSTFLFATNNLNALPLEGDQRRFCVVRTGPALAPDAANRFVRWMSVPANIGALWRLLQGRDPSLNPYIAPETETKTQMGLANRSDLDDVLDDFMAFVGERGQGCFTTRHARVWGARAGLSEPEVKVMQGKLKSRAVRPFGGAKSKVGDNAWRIDVLDGFQSRIASIAEAGAWARIVEEALESSTLFSGDDPEE